ncbi:hypothetical protein BDZ89DRAFT_1083258 [Hymenopellis radicata]|nr:hypothetical protein BDZ89DRAFT_1083258 [Hymenopellis radicata]
MLRRGLHTSTRTLRYDDDEDQDQDLRDNKDIMSKTPYVVTRTTQFNEDSHATMARTAPRGPVLRG